MSSLERPEDGMQHIEWLLLTAVTGAMTVGLGTLMWPALANLDTVFTQLTHALQVTP
jgi:hypothetical protein